MTMDPQDAGATNESQKICPSCGHPTEEWAKVCEMCKSELAPPETTWSTGPTQVFRALGCILGVLMFPALGVAYLIGGMSDGMGSDMPIRVVLSAGIPIVAGMFIIHLVLNRKR